MSYNGYFTLDGAEFANAARFESAVAAASWFRTNLERDDLPFLLTGTATSYTDAYPDITDAPWYDPAVPVSADFFGLYILDVTGLDDSSGEASPIESTEVGGIPGRVRHAIKEAAFTAFIAGATEEAVSYGFEWLKRTLLGGVCSPLDARKQGLGADLRYYAAEPLVGDDEGPEQVEARLARTRRRVACTRGPVQGATKRVGGCGHVLWGVSFTLTIGDPLVYRDPKHAVTGLFDTPTWGPDITAGTITETTFDEALCGLPIWEPLYDPLCAAAITTPAPPNVSLGCWTPPAVGTELARTVITLPEANFPRFSEVLPIITVLNNTPSPMRNIRFRFYPDPDGDLDLDANPCAWVSDMVLSFMPVGTLVIDASREQIHVTTSGGHTRRADSVVFATDQRPMKWPVLDCGTQYLFTVDILGVDTPVSVDLDLIARTI